MCGGGSAASSSREAEERARQEAAERERKINKGQRKIDQAFSQFDDSYYDSYADSIVGHQEPQVRDQYDEVNNKLTAALAGRGMLESTNAANRMGSLQGDFADQLTRIQSEAGNQAQQLQQNVERQKSDLYALNRASADPAGISAQAIGAASSVAAPSPSSDVGRLFDSALTPLVAYRKASDNAAPPRRQSTAPVASGTGSSRVVR